MSITVEITRDVNPSTILNKYFPLKEDKNRVNWCIRKILGRVNQPWSLAFQASFKKFSPTKYKNYIKDYFLNELSVDSVGGEKIPTFDAFFIKTGYDTGEKFPTLTGIGIMGDYCFILTFFKEYWPVLKVVNIKNNLPIVFVNGVESYKSQLESIENPEFNKSVDELVNYHFLIESLNNVVASIHLFSNSIYNNLKYKPSQKYSIGELDLVNRVFKGGLSSAWHYDRIKVTKCLDNLFKDFYYVIDKYQVQDYSKYGIKICDNEVEIIELI